MSRTDRFGRPAPVSRRDVAACEECRASWSAPLAVFDAAEHTRRTSHVTIVGMSQPMRRRA